MSNLVSVVKCKSVALSCPQFVSLMGLSFPRVLYFACPATHLTVIPHTSKTRRNSTGSDLRGCGKRKDQRTVINLLLSRTYSPEPLWIDMKLTQSNRKKSLNFGYGVHACPGRFFASQEIKLLMLYFLRNYDIKLADEAAGRPANIIKEFQVSPDVTKEVLIRKRAVS